MITIGIHSRKVDDFFYNIIQLAKENGFMVLLSSQMKNKISNSDFDFFNSENSKIDYLFTIGGDGTFLDSLDVISDFTIPVVGINTGRLGFLANVNSNEVDLLLNSIKNNLFTYVNRSVLELINPELTKKTLALNEITIQKDNLSNLITIQAFVNNKYINSYWCDGLIISTPTGSTAYSLSAGGPIVAQETNVLIITPITPHNLNVRPIIIPDHSVIRLVVESRHYSFLVTVDSYITNVNQGFNELVIKKHSKQLKTLCVEKYNFFDSLQNKLSWGIDKRN